MIIIDEIYGWDGTPNKGDFATSDQIARRVLAKDQALRVAYGAKVLVGPADTNIYEVRDGTSIASNMARDGLYWKRAYKGSGSRVAGLASLRKLLGSSMRGDLERPGLYFYNHAKNHLRTFPEMQYDETKYEDVNTDLEDHAYDSTRYMLTRKYTRLKHRKVKH